MASWAPGTKVKRFHKSKRKSGKNPTGAMLHIADQAIGKSTLGYVASDNDRNSHPTYVIQVNGDAWGVVHPDERPSSTYPGDIDDVCITIEFDNVTRAPDYQISDAQKATATRIMAHHAAESDRAGKGFVFNNPKEAQSGFFIGWHSQYRAVECPGKSVRNFTPVMIAELNGGKVPAAPAQPSPAPAPAPSGKSISQLADEVIAGKWGSGDNRKRRLGNQYAAVQAEVNRKLQVGQNKPAPQPARKNANELADEVLRGDWGNGDDRKNRLERAGHNYGQVMDAVNAKLRGNSAPAAPARKSNDTVAREVVRGNWGNGDERKRRLQAEGYDYSAIMKIVNRLI